MLRTWLPGIDHYRSGKFSGPDILEKGHPPVNKTHKTPHLTWMKPDHYWDSPPTKPVRSQRTSCQYNQPLEHIGSDAQNPKKDPRRTSLSARDTQSLKRATRGRAPAVEREGLPGVFLLTICEGSWRLYVAIKVPCLLRSYNSHTKRPLSCGDASSNPYALCARRVRVLLRCRLSHLPSGKRDQILVCMVKITCPALFRLSRDRNCK